VVASNPKQFIDFLKVDSTIRLEYALIVIDKNNIIIRLDDNSHIKESEKEIAIVNDKSSIESEVDVT
jgi:hypothetical protein